jgi:3',5'-cyclic AMP phosphodiesterase CpdA
MHIAVTADIHLGITSEKTVRSLLKRIIREKPDLLAIAGDIGEPLEHFDQVLRIFEGLGIKTVVVAGNHDLWHRSGGQSSMELWEKEVPAAVRKHGMVWLEDESLIVGSKAIVGTIGWYDYSARPRELAAKSDQAFFDTKGVFNNDARYLDWAYTDIEFSRIVGERFHARLQAAEEDPRVESIFVVTHVPIFSAQRITLPHWDPQSEAYFGNWTLGRIVESFSKVKRVASGHTHLGVHGLHLCPDGRKIPASVVNSDYERPGYFMVEL